MLILTQSQADKRSRYIRRKLLASSETMLEFIHGGTYGRAKQCLRTFAALLNELADLQKEWKMPANNVDEDPIY
jgi:hypothetical protein